VDGRCTSAAAVDKDAQLRDVAFAEDAQLRIEGFGLGLVDPAGLSYGHPDEDSDSWDSIAKMMAWTRETTDTTAEYNSPSTW